MEKYIKYTFEELVTQLKQFYKKNSSYNLIITNTTFGLKEENMATVKPPKWFVVWSTDFESRINQRFDKIEKDIIELKDRVTIIEKKLERNNIR